MQFDRRPFWRPRDVASLLDCSAAHVYRLVESGALPHVRVGHRTIRIPGPDLAAFLGLDTPATPAPATERTGETLQARSAAFLEQTGLSCDDWVAAWKQGTISDTAEHHDHLLTALELREALRAR